MSQMSASPQQIQAAAAAGVELLSDKDLRVPLGVSMGGQLGILSGMLNAIAQGELVLMKPEPAPSMADVLENGEGGDGAEGKNAS